MLGYSEEELTSGSFVAVTHPDDVAQSQAYLAKLLQGSIDAAQWEKRYIHRDGHVVWVQDHDLNGQRRKSPSSVLHGTVRRHRRAQGG
jgi:PAS domain S-box-containing protein